jgi:hypothetical protein
MTPQDDPRDPDAKRTAMANFFVEAAHLIAESKGISLRQAAEYMCAEIHRQYLEIVQAERFGTTPDQYSPKDDPDHPMHGWHGKEH